MGIFDGLEGVGAREPQKREPSQGFGACPFCSKDKVGLVRSPDGQHLVWRMHNLTTFSGIKLPCQATGQRVCAHPARKVPGYPVPLCPHSV